VRVGEIKTGLKQKEKGKMKKTTIGYALILACLLSTLAVDVSLSNSLQVQNGTLLSENDSNSNDWLSPVMEHVPPMPDPEGAAPKPEVGALPSEFSWRDYEGGDWTTMVKSQGGCGSCWDFAALGALEAVINIEYGDPALDLDLSEQYVLSCLPAAGSCEGGHSHWAFRYIKDEGPAGNWVNGIIPEWCFPYEADDTVPCADKCPEWKAHLIPIWDYGYWYPYLPSDRDAIKAQLIKKGPIVTYLTATGDFIYWGWTHHSPDDYYPYPGPVEPINHAVVIVGYKDDPDIGKGGYWIIKNSWGPSFGYQGFYNIEYDSLRHGEFITYVEYRWTPQISIYTDKYSYSVGDTLYLGLDLTNPGPALTACVAVWLERPVGGIRVILHAHAITLRPGLEYSNPSFKTFTLETTSTGTYIWHVAVLEPTTHDIIVEDTAEWEFS
jgi:C1A family cysteine protease